MTLGSPEEAEKAKSEMTGFVLYLFVKYFIF